MNVIHNRVEAERELRKAEKVLKNFEILCKGPDTGIASLHSIGLKSAHAELETAKRRVLRAKKLVRLRIQNIRHSAKR